MRNLAEVGAGETVVISHIEGSGPFRARLSEMGFVCGKTVKRLGCSPIGNPIVFELMGGQIALRRSEAEKILVQLPDAEKSFSKEATTHSRSAATDCPALQGAGLQDLRGFTSTDSYALLFPLFAHPPLLLRLRNGTQQQATDAKLPFYSEISRQGIGPCGRFSSHIPFISRLAASLHCFHQTFEIFRIYIADVPDAERVGL